MTKSLLAAGTISAIPIPQLKVFNISVGSTDPTAANHLKTGGKGQLSAVTEVMEELGVADIDVVAISKGPDRNAGREQFHMNGRQSFTLPPNASAMHFLQRLRDEAHRYAIGTHRTKRLKTELTSPLDAVPGIGPKRKKALLAHFGSARAVSAAGLKDLEAVEGISKTFAQQIFDWFYSGQK